MALRQIGSQIRRTLACGQEVPRLVCAWPNLLEDGISGGLKTRWFTSSSRVAAAAKAGEHFALVLRLVSFGDWSLLHRMSPRDLTSRSTVSLQRVDGSVRLEQARGGASSPFRCQ